MSEDDEVQWFLCRTEDGAILDTWTEPAPEWPPDPLPDPSIISFWSCPICGESIERWGVEKRRIGWRPWRRLVHVDCHD